MGGKERMLLCRIVEQIGRNVDFSKRLGVEDRSTFRGVPVKTTAEIRKRE